MRGYHWLSAFFVFAGLMHFFSPEPFVRAVPAYLPAPLALVYISGIAEVILGALLLSSSTRLFAVYGLIALLIAVYPANINMALNPALFPDLPVWLLWLRLPLQFLFIYCLWRVRK